MFSLFLSGLVLGSGPCLLTCGPILISYIVATGKNPRQAFFFWLLFSLSRILVYIFLGVSVFLLGEFLVRQNLLFLGGYIYLLSGIIIILIGLFTIISNVGEKNRLCSSISKLLEQRLSKVSPITMGLILGLLPCAPLLAVLSYIGLVSFSWQVSILYSLIFGVGTLISPLVLLSLGAGVIPKILFNKPKAYRALRYISGSIIILFGAQLIFLYIYG